MYVVDLKFLIMATTVYFKSYIELEFQFGLAICVPC